MKKIVFILSFSIISIFNANAQELELGLRFGDITASSTAIDIVLPMGESTRIHTDISFGNGVGVDVLWDFIYKPLGNETLHWYAGLGPYTLIGNKFRLGAAGEIGLEYRFNDLPLVIGADWRPSLKIINFIGLRFNTFGFNVRYHI